MDPAAPLVASLGADEKPKLPEASRWCVEQVGKHAAHCMLLCSAALASVVVVPLTDEVSANIVVAASVVCSGMAAFIVIGIHAITGTLRELSARIDDVASLQSQRRDSHGRRTSSFGTPPTAISCIAEVSNVESSLEVLGTRLSLALPYLPEVVTSALENGIDADVPFEDDEDDDEESSQLVGMPTDYSGALQDFRFGSDEDESDDVLGTTCPQFNFREAASPDTDESPVMNPSSSGPPAGDCTESSSPRSAMIRMCRNISFSSSPRVSDDRHVEHVGFSSGEETPDDERYRRTAAHVSMRTRKKLPRGESRRFSSKDSTVLKEPTLRAGQALQALRASSLNLTADLKVATATVPPVALPQQRDDRLSPTNTSPSSPVGFRIASRSKALSSQINHRVQRKPLPGTGSIDALEASVMSNNSLMSPTGGLHKRQRMPSCRDVLTAMQRTSTSSSLKRVSQELDERTPPNTLCVKALRDSMTKRKGTLLSVEFGVMELADDNTHDTYALASSLVSVVLDIVKQESGNVFQLRADGLIASWNTHHACTRHAWSACRAALEIRKAMESVEDPRDRVGWSVSVVTGYLYCGNIGNDTMKAPFVLGSVLEDCRRLNELSRVLQAPVLILESVQDVVADLPSRPIDVVRFDGSPRAEMVYELLRDCDTCDLCLWREAFHGFIEGNYGEAINKLETMMQNQAAEGSPTQERKENEEYCQLERFCAFVKTIRDNPNIVPHPYYRKLSGWEEWSPEVVLEPVLSLSAVNDSPPSLIPVTNANFLATDSFSPERTTALQRRRKRLPSSAESLPPVQAVKSPMFTSEMLKLAIDEAKVPTFDNPNSDSDSDSDSDLFRSGMADEPPTSFTDAQGSVWKRSSKQLGKGVFGEVWLGMSEEGSLVALKCIPAPQQATTKFRRPTKFGKADPAAEAIDSAINEVKMLSEYQDEHVVSFISCGVYERFVIITMEYVSGGSLASVLEQFGSIPVPTTKRYTKDILRGLVYLHSNDIVHRDLKPANVLMHTDGQCKLSDFGTSVDLSEIAVGGKAEGTPLFMSPEACRGEPCKASDLWALGLTTAQMLTGQLPFGWADSVPKGQHNYMRWLCQEEGEVPQPPRHLCGNEGANFVEKTLRRTPGQRRSADQLLYDPFAM